MFRDAGDKAASIRKLRRTSVPVPMLKSRPGARKPPRVLAGVLGVSSVWSDDALEINLANALGQLAPEQSLDLGCVLTQGAFETEPGASATGPANGPQPRRRGRPPSRGVGRRVAIHLSAKEEALIFFFIRLVERLRAMGNAPAPDLMAYKPGTARMFPPR